MVVIVDIDGVLADASHRLHHIEKTPSDWNSFYDAMPADKPVYPVIDLVKALHKGFVDIILITGRPETHREQTEKWLRQFYVPFEKLAMRAAGDHRHDTVVKPELLDSLDLDPARILGFLEDRPSMCRRWREFGYPVYQLSEREF